MIRYGIAEWYGHPFMKLTPERRRDFASVALGRSETLPCPFRNMPCNKRGGVCSIRRYEDNDGSIGKAVGDPVIVCPVRFEQNLLVVSWLASIVGFSTDDVMVAREIPFMRSMNTSRPAGKIDLVIAADENHGLKWFGLEIQAVYFSGHGMDSEFRLLLDSTDYPPFPNSVRRPDWRSSGAKRLMPQLQVKGPTLRRWHSKLAVAVDRPFFAAIGGPSRNASHDLNDGDVIWLVPKLSSDYRLEREHWEVLTLEDSESKLLFCRG